EANSSRDVARTIGNRVADRLRSHFINASSPWSKPRTNRQPLLTQVVAQTQTQELMLQQLLAALQQSGTTASSTVSVYFQDETWLQR
ncbi:MAG: hypothetical protein HC769_35125, partial [Cyanobacteria bacterium CRU_2_1]|nr:hypothetical protein [Cyanobacteria bacterium CRU_2_1]